MSGIRFCKVCENMLYIELNEENSDEFSYYCRKCGNKESIQDTKEYCISKLYVNSTEQKINEIVNDNTTQDQLLPEIEIDCPNKECDGDTAIFLRYSEENMKYIYLCKKCKTKWNVLN